LTSATLGDIVDIAISRAEWFQHPARRNPATMRSPTVIVVIPFIAAR
jgi:hypothetical protein